MAKAVRDGRIVGTYAKFDDIVNYMNSLSAQNSFVKVYSAGKSFQGRNMSVAKIDTGSTQRALWFDCGIHAREWVAPSTCVYMLDKVFKLLSILIIFC